MSNRRTTLGPLSMSSLNSRSLSGSGRMSMGVMGSGSVLDFQKPAAARMSLGPASTSMMATTSARRSSISANQHLIQQQPRKSTSLSLNPRGSSLSSSARQTDPRNITDKQFIAASIRTLIEFLSQRAYDQPISPKILTKPTNKDYYMIVLFLFRQVDPNYALSGKLEDEIVSMFKFLNYPYPIAKSNISAVGSPHAWPNMLASIMWLIELLLYDEAVQSDEHK